MKSPKIIGFGELLQWRHNCYNKKLVVTNGCFQILHAGHIQCLQSAKAMGDLLLVGLNSDSSIIQLKGKGRLIVGEQERAQVLSALQCVDAVCIFYEKRATEFLRRAKPDIWVKGGDYTLDSLDPEERDCVASAQICLIPLLSGHSTSKMVEKISRLEGFDS